MDSSDSEDNYYGNVAQNLQNIKNTYKEYLSFLDESSEDTRKLNDKPPENASKTESKPENLNERSDKEDEDIMSLDTILAMSSKRVTRSKRKCTETIPAKTASKKPNKRKKKNEPANPETSATTSVSTISTRAAVPQNVTNEVIQLNTSQSRGRGRRGRGRARGRGSRGRNRVRNYFDQPSDIPTYSVGNTDEYPDQSDHQQLFSSSKKPTDDVVILDDNETDENEELSVKVYWQSVEFFKFTIRKYQKLNQIFDFFSKKENVSNDKLLFTFNDQILRPDDTPDSINYSIVKFIDGGIINQNVSDLVTKDKEEKCGIKLKFQCQNVKKPFETKIGLDEKMSVAMMKCAEHFEISLEKLKFQFDGDAISGKCTARDLELEGGECIDVKIIST